MSRIRWESKLLFLYATIGSAVGLGNIWRFPYLAGKYGGGAFLLPYFIMLLSLGIPLLIMEFAIGQKMQQGSVGALYKISPRFAGIGFAASCCSLVIASYYTVIIAWCLLYFFFSFDLSWGINTKDFFFNQVLNISDNVNSIGSIASPVLFSLVAIWVMVYFSVWKGISSLQQVLKITLPLPFILLIILLIRTVSLPNATEGISLYLTPDFSALLDPEIWSAACAQIFFSIGLSTGVMISFASYKSKNSDITGNAIITAVTNSGVSILSGFIIFSTLGYMAMTNQVAITDLSASGPSLAFVVLPQALSSMPWAPLFAVLFFLLLLNLAIDSAFSLIEAVSTSIKDRFPHVRKEDVALHVCAVGLISGIIFTTKSGIHYLDIVDHFIASFGLLLVCLLQTIAIAWIYGAKQLHTYINEVSTTHLGLWWIVVVKYFIPVLLTLLLLNNFYTAITTNYGGYPQWALWVFGWCVLLAIIISSAVFACLSKPNHIIK